MLVSILEWLASWILNYLASLATTAIKDTVDDMKRDKERGEINDANVKAYEDAVSRKDRVEAALSLLNRLKR